MNCPNCGKLLVKQTIDDIDLDICQDCGGTWFDKGELTREKDVAMPDARWLDFDIWKNHETLSLSWGDRNCPKCGKVMAAVSYGTTGVVVDACAQEDGIWLDKGEFSSILAALEAEIDSKTLSEYLKATVDEGKELITGEEGLPSEWKDFSTILRLMQYRMLVEHPRLANSLAIFLPSSPLK